MSSINDDNMATVSTKTTSSKLVHTNQEQQQDDNKSNGDSHREQHQLQSSSTMINNKLRKSTMKKQQEEIDDLNMVENNESSSSNNVIKENSITMKEMKGHSISICIDSVDELETKNADDEIVTIMQESNNNDQSSMMINENVISSLSKQFIDGLIINDTNESNGKNRDNSVRPKSTHSMDGSLKKRSKPLIRSGAVRESSLSPSPPPIQLSNGGSNETLNLIKNVGSSTNHLTVAYSTVCGSIINNGNNTVSGSNISQPISLTTSSKNSSIISSNTSSPSLSRDSSSEIQEISVAEAKTFLTETLKKSLKDRQFLYKIEQDLAQFLNDTTRDTLKIQQASSYNRMLIHKTADYYQLEHLVDQAHSSVILTKNSNTRQPDESFKEMIAKDQRDETIGQKKSILKRDSTSLDDSPGSSFDKDKSPDNSLLLNGGGASLVSGGSGCGTGSLSDSSRSRSLEEREENYEKVRARIFSQQDAKDADSSSSQSSKSKLQLQTGNEENSDNKLIQSPQQPVDSSSLDSNSQNNNCDTNENVLEIIDTNITNIQKQPLIDKKENNNNNSQQMMQRRKPQNSYVGSNSNRNGGKSGGYTGRVNKYHNMYHHQSYQHHQSAQPPFHPPPATQPYYNYQPQSYHQSSSSHQSAASYRPANPSHHHHHQNQYHSQRFDSSNHNNNNSNHQHPHSRGPYRSNVMNNNPKNNPYHQTSGGGGGYNARHSHPGGTGNFGSHHRMNHPSSMSSIHQLSNQQPPAHHLIEQQPNPYAPYLRVPGVTAYNPYMDPNANNQYQYLHSIPNEQFYTYMNQSAMGGIQQPPSHSTPLLANPPTHQILPHQSSTNVPPNNTNITSTAGQPNHQYTLSIANGYPMMYGPNIQSAMQHQSNPNSHVPYSHPHPHSLVPPSQANVSPSYSIINPYGTIPMNLIAQPKMDETIQQSSQQKTDIRRNQLGPNGHQLNNGQPPPIDTSLSSYDRIAQVHYPHTCKANSQPQAAIHNVCYNIPTNVNTANEVKNSPIIGSSIKTNKQKCQQQYSMTGHGNGGSHQHQQQLAKQSRSTARNHDNSNNTQQQTNKLVTKMATSK
ncbi:R3H domain-containing protein 2 [Dermatophagoides pteronyssinus]|uniref:R3H domain-containing protein 2 n=1 Tax=Dermatophagoides pteronyssinus TaxID=6956 RepID=A0ABQ8JUW1_DERPT|nr:R3H domain-containing protein 2 [Dermatophagoides pteronyssinus]